MSGKREYEAAVAALYAHYMSEEEKRIGEEIGIAGCEEEEEGIGEKGKGNISASPERIKITGKEEKIESVREKRRKIRQRSEFLDTSLAEESSRLTAVLERVANALVPVSATTSEKPEPLAEATELRLRTLEARLENAQGALEEVKGNTMEILKILQQK
ncbi:hypothetical protein HOY82DRAFT_606843 [Tuber indicum]|nr:hypothetical protein HOY82DRAFT_606843 [Tuber indicum]